LCHLDDIPRGATEARLLDETSEPAAWIEITLDPVLDANRNAQARFERARKAERGVAIARERLDEAEVQVERVRAVLQALEEGQPLADLASGAEALGIRFASGGATSSASKQQKARVPYRVFLGAGAKKILVGKGAGDNDTLTLTVARPHDTWLHARDSAGAHVVVPLDRKATIDPELLLDAAHLAAHFSKQRGEPLVEIAHTERRFVRKPKGAAPGSVNVDRERVFLLRLERERLQRLLASERT
jgi:predicted ribosome quality control (RQC) complex YloA/Tae2 family protein